MEGLVAQREEMGKFDEDGPFRYSGRPVIASLPMKDQPSSVSILSERTSLGQRNARANAKGTHTSISEYVSHWLSL